VTAYNTEKAPKSYKGVQLLRAESVSDRQNETEEERQKKLEIVARKAKKRGR